MYDYQNVLEEEQENMQQGLFLTFSINEEAYGIKIDEVQEIIGMQKISLLPETPEYIKGIINLRGKVIPVIDVQLKFNNKPTEYTSRTCIIVVETDELLVGLIVDQVKEVVSIEDNNIVPPPDFHTELKCRYLEGVGMIGERVILLIDCSRLFDEQEFKSLSDIGAEDKTVIKA